MHVTRGHDGQHAMVLEQMVYTDGGQGCIIIFAQTASANLSLGWELMNTIMYQYSGGAGRTALLGYDYGDPTTRYLQSDGYYYIVPATWDKQGRSAPVAPGIYPCCAVHEAKILPAGWTPHQTQVKLAIFHCRIYSTPSTGMRAWRIVVWPSWLHVKY